MLPKKYSRENQNGNPADAADHVVGDEARVGHAPIPATKGAKVRIMRDESGN